MQNCDIKAGGLLILQPLLQDEIIAALADGDAQTVSCGLARHYASPADGQPHEGLNPAALYVLRRLLSADNYFSRRMAAGGAALQPALLTAMAAEIALLQGWLADYQPPAWLQAVGEDVLALCPELADWAQMEPAWAAAVLARFHQRFGFGQLALHRVWRWQGELQLVQQYDQISLSDLVGYQIQKDEVMANTRLFAREGRGNNLLLYGARGTGKSSLVNLIPRFYDVHRGKVLVDGLDVRDYPLDSLRGRIGMVLQNNVLFSGTIRENLLWGNENAAEEELIQAAKDAQAYDFIMSFPDGFDTSLDQGGVNVSGGQKQRLCIARAMVRRPAVLILDDSTSAVDSTTEGKIRSSFRENLKGTTVIIIAQRISSVQYADKIVVLDEGTVAGVGTHDELMETNQIYKEIYDSQQEGGDGNG